MQQIPLQAIPNQQFQLVIDTHRYDIRLLQCYNIMAIDISRDETMIVQGMRCLPNQPIIPYKYLEGGCGNFMFVTPTEEFPTYTRLDVDQYLFYITDAEMEAARG